VTTKLQTINTYIVLQLKIYCCKRK